jgi:hypothetical protein
MVERSLSTSTERGDRRPAKSHGTTSVALRAPFVAPCDLANSECVNDVMALFGVNDVLALFGVNDVLALFGVNDVLALNNY